MSKKRKKPKPVSLPVVGRSGNIEIYMVEMPDPFEPDKKLMVAKNIATHPLDHLRARNAVTHDQKAAGDRFLALYEAAEIGGAKAIDYSRVKVDVSFEHKGLDPKTSEAIDQLEAIRAIVGRRSYRLLWDVIGRRQSPYQIAAQIDQSSVGSRRTREFLMTALRNALDDLIAHFDVVAIGRKPRAA
jgi:hypothetical protein